MAAVSDGRFIICAYWISSMPSMVFDVHTVGVGCIIQGCNICVVVMSAVTGRSHLHWRYRTFKTRLIRRCGARLGLRPVSLICISLFALQTQFCLFIVNLYLQFRFKCLIECGVRGALRGG